MDINAILKQMTGNADVMQTAAESTADYYRADTDKIVALQGTAESQARQLAANTEQAGMDAAAANYMVNKGREANAAAAGMNPDDQNNLYIQSLAQITEARAAQDVSRAEYNKLNSVGFLDSPVGYIMAQLQLPQVAEKHNQALAAEQIANSRAQETIKLINAKDTLIAANTADTLRKVDEQKAKQAGLQAQMQLTKLQIENISVVGQRAIQALQTQAIGYQASKDILTTQMDAEKFKLQQESLAIQREQQNMLRQEQLKRKGDEAAAKAEQQQQWAAASALLGYATPPNPKNLTPEQRAIIEKTGATLLLGNNPYEAIENMRKAGNAQVILQTNGGLGEMVQGTSVAIKQAADQLRKTDKLRTFKPGEAEKEGTAKWQADTYASASSYEATNPMNSPTWDTTFNPYKPKYLALADAAKAGTIPALKNNAAVAIIDTLPKDPTQGNLTGKQLETVFQTISQRVANGTLAVDQAAKDIATLHKVGAGMNREQLGYELLGLPPQTGAFAVIPGTAAFSDPVKVDLMNEASVKTALMKMVSQRSSIANIGTSLQPLIPQRMGGAFDILQLAGQAATQPKK